MAVWLWAGFILFVLTLIVLDLAFINKKDTEISVRKALMWTGFCVVLALGFTGLIYGLYEFHWFGMGQGSHANSGKQAALLFLTGYLIEESLSLDNLFVIAMIFTYFRIPRKYQHRVLFWGILGALVFRGIFIGVGSLLIAKFNWIIYVFGILLLVSAIKLLINRNEDIKIEKNILVKLIKRFYPITATFDGHRFFTRIDGKKAMTPLFLALLVVETSDVIFAVDSIPAIFAITSDPFLVFTSNIFAILGLRSLYFALAAIMDKFKYLKVSLVFILFFVGCKMLLVNLYHIPVWLSLGVIVGTLSVGIAASLVKGDTQHSFIKGR